MPTSLRCICAFALGWIVFLFTVVQDYYDGLMSLIGYPIWATLYSGVFVGLALIAGFALRLPVLKRGWSRLGYLVVLIPVAAAGVLLLHVHLGLSVESGYEDPETGMKLKGMEPVLFYLTYFLLIFPVVNFPNEKDMRQAEGDESTVPHA